jgi:predicted phosphohydrolase
VDTLHEYGDPPCYFGHIHGMYNTPKEFDFEGIPMHLISSDAMDFTLYRIPTVQN